MSELIYNSNYLDKKEAREYNLFAEEYFSGSDIKLLANNKEIKQISMIQYELQENLKPIYGYSSYTYDDIAVGSRLVTGAFICPVKNLAKNNDFNTMQDKNNKAKNVEDVYKYNSFYKKPFNEYQMSISNENVYLSNSFLETMKINTIINESVIVKDEGSNYLLIYSPVKNLIGYIRK